MEYLKIPTFKPRIRILFNLKKDIMENPWVKRILYGLAIAIAQLALIKLVKFSLWAVILLFLLLGGLMKILEHRNFAWAIFFGTILFGVFMYAYGWTIMDGWLSPADYFKSK